MKYVLIDPFVVIRGYHDKALLKGLITRKEADQLDYVSNAIRIGKWLSASR